MLKSVKYRVDRYKGTTFFPEYKRGWFGWWWPFFKSDGTIVYFKDEQAAWDWLETNPNPNDYSIRGRHAYTRPKKG